MESIPAGSESAARAILVSVALKSGTDWEAEDSLDELARLADTLGSVVVGRMSQQRGRPDPATYLGRGKAQELGERVRSEQATQVIFDCELSPAQERNLTRLLGVAVMDRTLLILEIFARRARSHESKTQVELARAEYYLSHVAGRWSHLERQRGSLSARAGPGETQIEVDRRILRGRIRRLRRDLEKIVRARAVRRAPRDVFFQIAFVGYTNAGKSTLFNALTKARVFVEDRLFATLDSTVRSMRGPFGETMLLTDTVGFLRKLPPRLVASFRSTLEELAQADLLLEVVDVSHPRFAEQMQTTEGVLADLRLHELPRIRIFNKIDRAKDAHLERARGLCPEALFVCAREDKSVAALREAFLGRVAASYKEDSVEVNLAREPKVRASIHELAHVLEENIQDSKAVLRFRTSPRRYARIREILDASAAGG
jgi:GTP-binding protein HflX